MLCLARHMEARVTKDAVTPGGLTPGGFNDYHEL